MKCPATPQAARISAFEPLEPRCLLNAAPVATPSWDNTPTNTPLVASVTATDADHDPLTFSVQDQPSHGLLTMQSDGSFQYQPDTDYVGDDAFTFLANDGQADSAPATVSIAVGSIFTVSAGHPHKFQDATGDWYTVSLGGHGSATLYFAQDNGTDLDHAVLEQTDSTSSLKISPSRAGATTTVGEIVVEGGSLKSLSAATANLTGAGIVVQGTGVIAATSVRDLLNGSGIDMGQSTAPITTIQAGQLAANSYILAGSAIQTLSIASWSSGVLEGTTVKTFTVSGSKARKLAGDFGATVALSGQDAKGVSLGTFTVAGTVSGGRVQTAGSMNTVSIGAAQNSKFLAGMVAGLDGAPAGPEDFVNAAATIKSFSVKGTGASTARFFAGSSILASRVGTVKLRNTDLANCDIYVPTTTGTITSLQNKDSDPANKADNWTWTPKSKTSLPAIVHVVTAQRTLKVWLQAGPVAADGTYSVNVYAQILNGSPGDAICDLSIDITSAGSTGLTAPVADGGQVDTTWSSDVNKFDVKVPATAADLDGDGDMDASEMVLAMLNYKANIGQTAILLGTETWQMLGSGPVQLAVQVDPTSQVWDAASSTHVQFEGVSNLGTIVS